MNKKENEKMEQIDQIAKEIVKVLLDSKISYSKAEQVLRVAKWKIANDVILRS